MNSDHPKINFGKTGVLLINLGTPDSTKWFDIRKYLRDPSLTVIIPSLKDSPYIELHIVKKYTIFRQQRTKVRSGKCQHGFPFPENIFEICVQPIC